MSAEHTIPLADGMRVRHDAQAHFLVASGETRLEDRLVGAESIAGAFTMACVVYNRLAVSGGVSWWNPVTGEPISRPKMSVWFRPQDVLTADQECTCPRCLAA